jgi:hypothetical protein
MQGTVLVQEPLPQSAAMHTMAHSSVLQHLATCAAS